MSDLDALRLALYVFHLPSAVRQARERQLPTGVPRLLEVAAREPGAAESAGLALERPPEVVRDACSFFIEQVLLAPGADAYRILGSERSVSEATLRRHMALMQRWAHPDLDRSGEKAGHASRVAAAWESLKTQERRAAYDAAHPPRANQASGRLRHRRRRASNEAGRSNAILGAALRLILGSRRR